ncbi:MAG: hypothetical protein WBX25_17795 [Rhodomicrobium sp.]
MNNLKEKPRERPNASRLSCPIHASSVALGNYLNGSAGVASAPFRSANGLAFESAEMLPSIFRSNQALTGREARYDGRRVPDRAPIAPSDAPSRSHGSKMTTRLYVAVVFLLCLVAAEGLLLAKPAFYGAPAEPASLRADQAAIATVFSANIIEESQPEPIAATPSLLTNEERWSATVETFKQLIAHQKASQVSIVKQAANERLLGQLEAWMKGKARL